MAEYFVHHTGDNSTGASWATAFTSVDSADTAVAFASGDILNIGHDHVCPVVHAASLTITGPTSGLPVIFRSVTQGSDPVTYQKGTGTQIDTTEGATFDVTFDGSFRLEGILVKSGRSIIVDQTNAEQFLSNDCTFAPGPTGSGIQTGNNAVRRIELKKTVIDLTQDGTTDRSTAVVTVTSSGAGFAINGLTFVNAAFRTGTIFNATGSAIGKREVYGADFSGFTNATACELVGGNSPRFILGNCKTAGTFALFDSSTPLTATYILATNVGPTDDPTALQLHTYSGDIVSSTLIYRSSGATIEGIANSWLVTTTANCNEYAPFHSPWIYGLVSSTGSKTFDTYITNDTADFTNAQVWLEVEYLATSDSALWTLASDQRATITTTAADQDDDTTSTWVGAGPAYTYKQRLRVTATVGETGQFRARVVTGVASIASSRYYHIDPLVVVT